MSVTPIDFFAEANDLARRSDEIGRRTAINRAYYGAYLLMRDATENYPAPPPSDHGEGMHAALIRKLRYPHRSGVPGSSIARQMGEKLRRLRELRTLADYTPENSVSAAEVRTALELAKDIQVLAARFDTCRHNLASPPPLPAQAGIS